MASRVHEWDAPSSVRLSRAASRARHARGRVAASRLGLLITLGGDRSVATCDRSPTIIARTAHNTIIPNDRVRRQRRRPTPMRSAASLQRLGKSYTAM